MLFNNCTILYVLQNTPINRQTETVCNLTMIYEVDKVNKTSTLLLYVIVRACAKLALDLVDMVTLAIQ